MTGTDVRPVGIVTDAYGRELEIGQDHDGWYLKVAAVIDSKIVPFTIVIGGSARDDVMKKIFEADELAVQWAEANQQGDLP